MGEGTGMSTSRFPNMQYVASAQRYSPKSITPSLFASHSAKTLLVNTLRVSSCRAVESSVKNSCMSMVPLPSASYLRKTRQSFLSSRGFRRRNSTVLSSRSLGGTCVLNAMQMGSDRVGAIVAT